MRPVGEQSAFIGGLAAACAGMHAALSAEPGAVIDVSIQEALATMAATELARAGLGRKIWSRRRLTDGNGATVTILPARDGYAAISPREDRQWAAWLEVMGSPDWAADPRFARKPDRVANWDALHALMSAWSRRYGKQSIADKAQAAHVPSFPLREPAEQLASPQLAHRDFWRPFDIGGRTIQAPGPPFGLRITAAGRKDRRPCRTDAALRHSRARLQLGHRRPDGDTLSRRDGCRGHQDRGAGPRRPGPRLRIAHGARPGQAQRRPRPQEAGGRRRRAGAGRQIRRADREFRDRRHGSAGARRRSPAGSQSRSDLRLGLRPRPHRARGARRRLRHLAAMLCRVRRAQPPSRCRAADRLCLARPDVRPDAGLHRRRRRCGIGDGRAAWRGSISR